LLTDVTTDVNCMSKSNVPVNVFGFRTHAHELGTVITGYKYFPKVSVSFLTYFAKEARFEIFNN
jgi:hypothetical protein